MKFSIIIPVYNVEQYLADCLDSVLAQDYTGSYEVICINDGSTDSSLEILKQYANKNEIIKIIDQENKGLSGARNRGLKEAIGEYVFFLDSDDWIETNTLQTLSASIVANEDIIAFNGRRYFEDGRQEDEDEGIEEKKMTGWEYYNKYALQSRKFHFVCVVLRLYRKDFLLKNKLFFEEDIYHEDNLFTPLACYNAKVVKAIPSTLYVYRIRKGSITQTVGIKHLRDRMEVANQLSDFFIPKTDIDKSVVYREIAGAYFSIFMPDKVDIYNREYDTIKSIISWTSYKTVSTYPRHRRIYHLLRINVRLFHLYLKIEEKIKK